MVKALLILLLLCTGCSTTKLHGPCDDPQGYWAVSDSTEVAR